MKLHFGGFVEHPFRGNLADIAVNILQDENGVFLRVAVYPDQVFDLGWRPRPGQTPFFFERFTGKTSKEIKELGEAAMDVYYKRRGYTG